jgi:transposase
LLCCVAVAAGFVPDSEGAEASLRDVLAAALEANRELTRLAGELREENARLRAENAGQAGELEKLHADLAVLQRMVFGRSSERSRPEPPGSDAVPGPAGQGAGTGTGNRRGPGARGGRRDYSHLPRFEVVWDFGGGGYCCPECGAPFTGLGSDHVTEQLDWLVVVRVRADCRRRYRRACDCRVPATVTAPGPPKAIGKGLFTNAFPAMLFTERFVAGRSMNSLVTGLARQGAEIAPGTLAGACAQAGALLAPLEEAITARSRGSWHLHADETTWRVFAPRGGDGPARWWLWVFLGPDTACFAMDATRSGAVLARHAGIDEKTGQLAADEGGPRRLVISSDFYAVYQSAGKKADGLVNLYCWAHIRRYFVRAGDANPAQLASWTAAWLERIKNLYAAHAQLMTAWAEAAAPEPREAAAAAARLDEAGTAWDEAIGVIDEARKKQMTAPGLQEPARKALATLDREWDGLTAHRDYPMIGPDNNPAERALRRPVVTRKNAYGSRNEDAARLAARIWTVTATAEMAGLNVIAYLTAYLDECGRNGGRPLTGPDLERFLPWHAAPADLRAWAQPPAPG